MSDQQQYSSWESSSAPPPAFQTQAQYQQYHAPPARPGGGAYPSIPTGSFGAHRPVVMAAAPVATQPPVDPNASLLELPGGEGEPAAAAKGARPRPPKKEVSEIPLTKEEKEGLERFSEDAIRNGAERYIAAEERKLHIKDSTTKELKECADVMEKNELFMKLYLRSCPNNNTHIGSYGDIEQLMVKPVRSRLDPVHIVSSTANALMYVKCPKCEHRSKQAIDEATKLINSGKRKEADYSAHPEQYPEIFDKKFPYVFETHSALKAAKAIKNYMDNRHTIDHKLVITRIPADDSKRRKTQRMEDIVVEIPPQRL